ncbi:hypothetical protein NDU88_001583 [Pleurodeles waltl]|uniref:Uncharacterized protein n=1 Tax=Pleurodeles waltl TaxID=8319 RepID=A0AAV7VZD4_PLEWA|nr:hypothetical protein NDU88_001583 [Pleurodeles waltl]
MTVAMWVDSSWRGRRPESVVLLGAGREQKGHWAVREEQTDAGVPAGDLAEEGAAAAGVQNGGEVSGILTTPGGQLC